MEYKIADIRKDYTKKELNINAVNSDPILQFKIWFDEAVQAKVLEPNAMTLSTISANGFPSSRIILLKGIEENGFSFYTNYNSRKAKEIAENPKVASNFFWPELERQVRIEGVIEKTSEEVSDIYFKSRPRGSQIGAWASPQSTLIEGRDILQDRFKEIEEQFAGKDVPRPKHWGGYIILPQKIEFWQGRASRLHDRILFTQKKDHSWVVSRLAP